MKKFRLICAVIFCMVLLTACGSFRYTGPEEYFNPEVVYEDFGSAVLYDQNTDVMYYVKRDRDYFSITLTYNADGTPKLYEEIPAQTTEFE